MTDDHTADAAGRRIGRRSVLKATGGTAATAALAGCSPLLGGDGGSGEVNGSGSESGQIGTDPIQAGMLTFTRGAPGVLGIQAQRGAELAAQRINEAGGIAGQRELQIEVVDEGSNPLDSYSQFVEEGEDVTFGPISSGTHAQIAPEVEQNDAVKS